MKKELYLDEDKDLVQRIEDIKGPIPAGTALEERKQELELLQIESMLRSRKAAKENADSNSKFSSVIFFFSIVQLLIALYQLTFEVQKEHDSATKWLGVALVVIILVFMWAGSNILGKKFYSEK